MGLSLSMMRREQQRQRERQLRNTPQQPRHLTGIKRQVSDLLKQGVAQKDMITYDCTVCRDRFVWEQGKPLDKCPLCGAGAKQRPNNLPGKRMTHKQRRARAKAVAKLAAPVVFPVNAPLDAGNVTAVALSEGIDAGKVKAFAELIELNGPQLKGQALDDAEMRARWPEASE